MKREAKRAMVAKNTAKESLCQNRLQGRREVGL